MKVFLFLYPMREFFSHSNGYPDYDPELADRVVKYYGEAVDARYRQRGYEICWLMFRDEKGGFDFSSFDERVGLQKTDRLIDSGMTFVQHCPCLLKNVPKEEWPKPLYADLPSVFAQLPDPIEELWVAGFQWGDCVDKVAHHAYFKAGLKGRVHVDEDLTGFGVFKAREIFDPRSRDRVLEHHRFPLVREQWTYESLGFTDWPNWKSDRMFKRQRRIRNLRPWLVHN